MKDFKETAIIIAFWFNFAMNTYIGIMLILFLDFFD